MTGGSLEDHFTYFATSFFSAAILYDAANDNLWIGLRQDEKLETRSDKPFAMILGVSL